MKHSIVVLFCLLMANSISAQEKQLKFAMLHKSETQNIAMCILQEAYGNIDISTQFNAFPTTRSLKLSNSGEYDGETSRVIAAKNKYTNLIPVSTPLMTMKGMVFTTTLEEFVPDGFASLAPYNVIINYAVLFTEIGTRNLPSVQKANSYEAAFKMLLLNRGDLVIAPYLNGIAMLRKLGSPKIKALKNPVVEIPLYHFLNKKNQAMVPLIEAELAAMKTRGRLDEIYDQYIESLTDPNITPDFDNGDAPSISCPKV